ncbi:hypothetical protein [Pseudalkalibacillus sp. SCS-8]|uniref:hypothetical protein n=1 Tax=Pseudalkalibacillus nanhaiensis TaxID=3115291 RepID=UPI0032DA63AA
MIITSFEGEVLEKSKSNSPEEFFNRSTVHYKVDKGRIKTLSVLYVRYFEEKMAELTPFEADPIFEVDGKDIHLREVIAIQALINRPELQERTRVYINEESDFATLFDGVDIEALKNIVKTIHSNGEATLSVG